MTGQSRVPPTCVSRLVPAAFFDDRGEVARETRAEVRLALVRRVAPQIERLALIRFGGQVK